MGFDVKKKGFVRSGLHTERGVSARKLQRYVCKQCNKNFTFEVQNKRRRYSRGFVSSSVRRYLEDHASLRAVANNVGVSERGLLNWVMEYGKNSKSPLEVAVELKPKWSGLLGVDGKELKIKGKDATLLIAQDILTFDPVCFALADKENVEGSEKFFLTIRDVLQFPTKGIVSDLGRGRAFISVIDAIFPGIPHQACIVHFSRYVNRTVPRSKKSAYYQHNSILRGAIHSILFADQFNDAEEIFHRLLLARDQFTTPYHKTIIKSLERHFDLLTAHFHNPFLVRDNNIIENLIRQLNKKIKQSDGFKTTENTYNFLKLWFIYYRFKPFVNSRESFRNGKAPLQIAGVNLPGPDWLAFSQKRRPT
ncbi:MAG: transposase [Candidatus Latescibacterota bacterium]